MPSQVLAATHPRSTHRPRRLRRSLGAALSLLLLPSVAVGVVGAASSAGASVPDCAAADYTVAPLGGPNFYIDSSDASMRSAYTGYRVTNGTGAPVTDLYASIGQFTGGALGLGSGQTPAQRVGDLAVGGGTSVFWYLTASGANATAQNHVVTLYRRHPSLPTAVALCTTSGGFASVATTLSASANKVTGITLAGGAPRLGSTFTVSVAGTTGTIGQGIAGDANSFWMTPAVTAGWPADAFRLLSTSITMSPDGTAPAQTWSDRLRIAGLGSASRDYTASYTFRAVGFTGAASTVQPVQQITSGTQVKHTGSYSVGLPAIAPPVNDLTMAVAGSPGELDTGGGNATYTATVTGTAGAELDGFTVTLPADATVVPGTVTWNGQPIPDPVDVDGATYLSGPFTVPTGGGELLFEVHHGPAPGPQEVVVQGVVGPSYIGTTASVLDGSNAASATVSVNRAPHASDRSVVADAQGRASVPVTSLASDPDGDTLSVTSVSAATADVGVAGGAIEYAGAPGPEGEEVTYTVTDGRGATATGTLTVLPHGATPDPEPQTLTASAPASATVGDTVTVTASASSGLPPSFATSTPDVCSIDTDGVVTTLAPGTCTVEVTQPGDATYAPAPSSTVHVLVSTAPPTSSDQHVEVDASSPQSTPADQPVTIVATATSGLPVAFSSTTPAICAVDATSGTVTPVRAGSCVIALDQPGDSTTHPAAQVLVTVEVRLLSQSISATVADSLLAGATTTASASATSGLPVTWDSQSPSTCTVEGDGTVHAVSPGECRIRVRQGGDDRYAPADPVELVSTVSSPPVTPVTPVAQSITVTAPARVLGGPEPVRVAATATSGLPVSLRVLDGPCELADGGLSTPTAGTCTLEATQAGDAGHSPAADVHTTVQVVTPRDDRLDLPAGLTTSRRVDVLANDPSGLSLVAVSEAAHGRVALVQGAVTYLPDAGFRGADRFAYTVRDDDGRTASAEVNVTVANAAPSLLAEDVSQVAGTTTKIPLDVADPNGDALTVALVGAPAHVRAVVRGRHLVVTPAARVSGDVRLTLQVSDGAGGSATIVVVDRVSPAPVARARRFLTPDGTRASWSAADTDDATYEVLVDGDVRCRTTKRSCELPRIVGPAIDLDVRVVGADRTRSTPRATTTSGAHRVLMATVYFASGADRLTPAQRRRLQGVADRILALGFRGAQLDGYTDSDGGRAFNLALSHRRTGTVADLLRSRDIGSLQSWHGMQDPVASNTTAQGKAANRRVEIYVGF